MQQQTNKANSSKNKRLNNFIHLCVPRIKHKHPLDENFIKFGLYTITIDNNFIFAYNEYRELKQEGITLVRLIMFDNCIFYTTLVPEFYKNSKLII